MSRYIIVEGAEVTALDIREAITLDKTAYSEEYQVSLEQCLAWYNENNRIYTMIRDSATNKIIAYVNIFPVNDEYYERIKGGDFIDTLLPPDAIVEYLMPDLYSLYFSSIVIHPDFQNSAVFIELFNAITNKFIHLGNEGMYAKRMVADAVSDKGEKFCKLFGMLKSKTSGHNSSIYEVQMLPPKFRVSSPATTELKAYYGKIAETFHLSAAGTASGAKSTNPTDDTSIRITRTANSTADKTAPAHIFISYSSKEVNKAERVCQFLEGNGISCWIAPRDVNPGGNYPTQIVEAIRKCSLLILLASENTNVSGHVSNEISLAFDNKKVIIPFKIENINFTDEYLYFLGRKHWIEAHTNFEDSLQTLFSTIVPHIQGIIAAPSAISGLGNSASAEEKSSSGNSFSNIIRGTEKFFKTALKQYVLNYSDAFVREYYKASDVFSLTSEITSAGKNVPYNGPLFDFLLASIINSDKSHIIKFQGLPGNEKNAIMQHLFLMLYNKTSTESLHIAPFYVNLGYYNRIKLDTSSPIPAQFKREVTKDLSNYIAYCKKNVSLTPIVFVDGIRDFKSGNMFLDYILEDILKQLDRARFVVDLEIGTTNNKGRIRKLIPLAPARFEYIVDVSPIELSDDVKVKKYIEYMGDDYPNLEAILKKMKQMNFYTVDYYLLRLFADIIEATIYDDRFSISDLYETYCLDFFKGRKESLEEAARWAHIFAHTDIEIKDEDYFTNQIWILLRRHPSFIEFLISFNYVQNIKNADKLENLSVFEMILPKEITRFVTPRINDSSSTEEHLLNLIKNSYYKMNTYGKSEMTYWLGRIKTPNLAELATELLRVYYIEIKDEIAKRNASGLYLKRDKKVDLFLLRGITVSLIYKGCRDISDEAIINMFHDDLQSSINRGFHLEYYGDKKYIPSQDTLDFEDQLDVGGKTLEQLFNHLDRSVSASKGELVTELNLYTACALIQARFEVDPKRLKFDLTHYITRCIDALDTFIKTSRKTNPQIITYFKVMKNDFSEYLALPDKQNYSLTNETYNCYSKAKGVERAGWVDNLIPAPENIVEHMYNTWLMGLLYLPNSIDNETDYDKNKVLKMLLIHDLGETITGDIPKPQKVNAPQYAADEDFVMRSLLLKGTYPQMTNMTEYYSLWEEWEAKATINAHIAKDLDTIQAIYQFCIYNRQYPDKFSPERKKSWLDENKSLNTEIGSKIFELVIKDNTLF